MQNKEFIEKLEDYIIDHSSRSAIISILKELIKDFNGKYDYNLEGVPESLSIDIYNGKDYLFIDLNNETFNIRFSHSEIFLFNEEINYDDLKILLQEFFAGNYKFKKYFKDDLLLKQELIFNNLYLSKYNQIDIYKNLKKSDYLLVDGFNWFKKTLELG